MEEDSQEPGSPRSGCGRPIETQSHGQFFSSASGLDPSTQTSSQEFLVPNDVSRSLGVGGWRVVKGSRGLDLAQG